MGLVKFTVKVPSISPVFTKKNLLVMTFALQDPFCTPELY